MKILFVGDTDYDMYVNAFYHASKDIENVESDLFSTSEEVNFVRTSVVDRVQKKLAFGQKVKLLNKKLINKVQNNYYDIIFFYSCRLIYPSTIKSCKKYCKKINMYNNDNPFSKFYPKYYWRHYIKSLKYADLVYSYRQSNFSDYKKYNKNVKLLRSYYIKERNYYIDDEKISINCPDVVFLGHVENDERISYIKALLDAGIEVGVTETEWKKVNFNSDKLVLLHDSHKLYNEYLNKAKIALVFLSKINNDTYTRRCFEIPAVKTLMVAPINEDICSLYRLNEEFVGYANIDDFVKKVKIYLDYDNERNSMINKAYKRLIQDGHESKDRVNEVLTNYYITI